MGYSLSIQGMWYYSPDSTQTLHELQSPSGDVSVLPLVKMNFHGKCDTNTTFWVSYESGFIPERLFSLKLYFGEVALKGLVGLPDGPPGQGSPTPGPRTGTGPQPGRNQAAQQEVSGRAVSEASSAGPPSLALPPETPSPPTPVCGKIVFHETGPQCQKGWGPLP